MKNEDLSVGNPGQVLRRYTMPMFLSVLFQQFYSISDSVIAGKFAGESALAAVGASYPITMIFMAIAFGSNIGCSVVLSRLFGSKDYKNLKTAAFTTLISCFVLSIVLTFAGIGLGDWFMRLLRTPQDIFADSTVYLKIYIGGFLFMYVYNISNGIFSSMGDSKSPLLFLILSSVGNVALDILFVAVFRWGVAGAAWATFIAQGAAGVLAFCFLQKRLAKLETDKNVPKFSFAMLGEISWVAVPSIMQQSFVSVGNLFIQNLVNSFGTAVVAGYSATVKLNTFATTVFTTFGTAVSNYTGQNLGANRKDRIPAGVKAAEKLSLCAAVPLAVLYFFFAEFFVDLFLPADATSLALKTGVIYLKTVAPFYLIVSAKLIADGVLRGYSEMKLFMLATLTDLVLRVVLAYILAPVMGTMGIFVSWPIGWVIATGMSVVFMWRTHKKKTATE